LEPQASSASVRGFDHSLPQQNKKATRQHWVAFSFWWRTVAARKNGCMD
jgi:hypothetical protein